MMQTGTTENTMFWHGGMPGLAVGDHLLSRSRAADTRRSLMAMPRPYDQGVTDPDLVYFSNDRDFARAYAFQLELETPGGQLVNRGTLYRVEPIGDVDEDEDYRGTGISWAARSAIIVDVEEIDVRMRERDAVRIIGEHCTWDDGRPMYLDDGRLNITRQMEDHGFTQSDIDELVRPWTRWTRALERINRAARTRAATAHR